MVDRIELICVPRKSRAVMATMAISARMRAYSARPWPSSSRSHLSGRIDMWRPPVVLLGPARALSATIGPDAGTTIGGLWAGGHAVRPRAAARRRGGAGGGGGAGGKARA